MPFSSTQSQLTTRSNRAIRVLLLGFTCLFAAVFARVLQLQTAPSRDLSTQLAARRTSQPVPAIRGDILDAQGRLLATTYFGKRVAIDPLRFPNPPGPHMAALADTLDIPIESIAQRLVPRMAHNAAITPSSHERPSRYVSVGKVLEPWREPIVANLDIPGVWLESRPVRAYPATDLAASILGTVGIDHTGLLGIEHQLEQQLAGSPGSITYVRDAANNSLWIDPGNINLPTHGSSVQLTIDTHLQQLAIDGLTQGIQDADAAGGRLIMLDPNTGHVLAMVDLTPPPPEDAVALDWDNAREHLTADPKPRFITLLPPREGAKIHPALARNRCVEDVYEPGSTFKPFMWAATTEAGLATPDEIFDTEGGTYRLPYNRTLRDVTRRDEMTWAEVLINSSNVGMAKGTSRMTFDQMHAAVRRFGFGSRTGINLPGESPGIVTSLPNWSKYTHTSVAMGHEVSVTPIQMARAFSIFARKNELAGTLPNVHLVASTTESTAEDFAIHRVLDADVALQTREVLRGVTANLDRKLRRTSEQPTDWKYELFGKSGTAEIPLLSPPEGKKRPKGVKGYFPDQYNSSFIAAGPAHDPRLVVLVVIDDPGPERVRTRTHYGSSVAGPVVRRIMEQALTYLDAPPSPPSPTFEPPADPPSLAHAAQ